MKASSSKSAKAPAGQSARLSVRVSEEAYRRIFITSTMSGQTASALLDRLIIEHCREWALPAKMSDRAKTTDRADVAVQASESASVAA